MGFTAFAPIQRAPKLRSKFFPALVFVCALLSANSLLADEILVAGVSLPVTELRVVDANSVKLVIGETAEILSREVAEIRAVEATFADAAVGPRYSHTALAKIAASISAQGSAANPAMIALLGAWIKNVEMLSGDKRSDAIRELLASDTMTAFLNTTPVQGFLDNVVGVDLVAELAARDPLTFELRASGISGPTRSALIKRLRQLALSAISLRDYERAARASRALASLSSEPSGTADANMVPESASRELTIFVQRLREAIDATQNSNSDAASGSRKLFELFESTKPADLREAVFPLVIEAVHRIALATLTESRSETKFEETLGLLAKIPVNKTTPTTHRLLLEALAGLQSANSVAVLLEHQVALFLNAWSAVDASIASATRLAVLRVGEAAARNASSAVLAYDDIGKLFATYSLSITDRDFLRRAQIDGFLQQGQLQAANEMSAKLENYSLFDTLRFMRAGSFGSVTALVCYGLSFILLCVLLAIKIRARLQLSRGSAAADNSAAEAQQASQARAHQAYLSEATGDAEPLVGGFTVNKARMMSPVALEYRKLLADFGLQPTAELKEIKQAYRSQVKAVHPDLNPDLSETRRAEFIELTQRYERLLELRAEIGLQNGQ